VDFQETQDGREHGARGDPDDLFPYFLTTGRILMHY
jgi:hypothetical protein